MPLTLNLLIAVIVAPLFWILTMFLLIRQIRFLRSAVRVTGWVSKIEKKRESRNERELFQAFFKYMTATGVVKEVPDNHRTSQLHYEPGQRIELIVPNDPSIPARANSFLSIWMGVLIAFVIAVISTSSAILWNPSVN